MAAPFAVTVFVTLLESGSIFCTAAISTAATASDPSGELRNNDLAENREENNRRGPAVEGLTSFQLMVADVPIGSVSRFLQLREDGNSDEISSKRGRMTRPTLDDGREMMTATLPTRGKKKYNHRQQQFSEAKRSSEPPAEGRTWPLQGVDAPGVPVSDRSSGEGNTAAAILEIEGLLSETSHSRCYQDAKGVHRCNPNFYFIGTSKCGKKCGLHCTPFVRYSITARFCRRTFNKHLE